MTACPAIRLERCAFRHRRDARRPHRAGCPGDLRGRTDRVLAARAIGGTEHDLLAQPRVSGIMGSAGTCAGSGSAEVGTASRTVVTVPSNEGAALPGSVTYQAAAFPPPDFQAANNGFVSGKQKWKRRKPARSGAPGNNRGDETSGGGTAEPAERAGGDRQRERGWRLHLGLGQNREAREHALVERERQFLRLKACLIDEH